MLVTQRTPIACTSHRFEIINDLGTVTERKKAMLLPAKPPMSRCHPQTGLSRASDSESWSDRRSTPTLFLNVIDASVIICIAGQNIRISFGSRALSPLMIAPGSGNQPTILPRLEDGPDTGVRRMIARNPPIVTASKTGANSDSATKQDFRLLARVARRWFHGESRCC